VCSDRLEEVERYCEEADIDIESGHEVHEADGDSCYQQCDDANEPEGARRLAR
jgi:hypothetical protein